MTTVGPTPITPVSVRVPVLPSQAGSKINWTQWISAGAMIVTLVSGGALSVSAEQQLAIVAVIGLGTNVVTWVMRTWFTRAVTPQSL